MKFEIVFAIFTCGFTISESCDEAEYSDNCTVKNPGISYSSQEQCRMSNNVYLNPDLFSFNACSTCYRHITEEHFLPGKKLEPYRFWLIDKANKTYHLANVSDTQSPIWNTFATSKAQQLWARCCEAAISCCEEMLQTPRINGSNYCPKTWDGWSCWPDTLNGTTASQECPWHVYIHSDIPLCTRHATKVCWENATWFKYFGTHEWSNYTSCGQRHNIHDLLTAHIITFAISIAFLIPALVIFFRYKQLQVIRISMHKNLFISLLLNAIFVIVFESYFMRDSLANGDESLVQTNAVFAFQFLDCGNGSSSRRSSLVCKIFYTITKYLRMCTYMWMFCEGFYLHKLIAAAFAEQKKFITFFLMGWGFPVFFIGIWVALRQIYANKGCWTVPYNYFEWVMFVPMFLAIITNFIFLCNIIRVLCTKLRSSHANEPKQFRRAVKATVVLVPLFGIHFFLVMYHPSTGHCIAMHVYNMVTYCIDGLQGALVAIIFCYLNNEVIYLLKSSYRRQKLVRTVGSQATNNSKRVTRMESRASVSTMSSMVTSYMERKRLSK